MGISQKKFDEFYDFGESALTLAVFTAVDLSKYWGQPQIWEEMW